MGESTKILVIGGGPAGSTAATLLARAGFPVTLLERDRFPRYHIGESILPSCLPILDQLGARSKIESHGFQRKGGAYFEWGSEQWDLTFGQLSGQNTYSWQVIRSEFDNILLEHAASQGVDVRQETSVRDVRFDGDRPVAVRWAGNQGNGTGEISFDYLVDASGRTGVLATKYLKNRVVHDVFRNVGIWGYWRGAHKLPKGPDGAIAVCSVPGGWFWLIPLHDGTVSVGLVIGKQQFAEERSRHANVEELYRAVIPACPLVSEALADATLVSDIKVETDYSYAASSFAGPGYVLAGDAACFLDPLLSTGVHLATFSGMAAAASLSTVLRGEMSEAEGLGFYGTIYRHAYERLLVLVSVFYQAYRGKDEHFFNAQKLTWRDRQGLRLDESFLNIVSGLEDLADAQDSAYELVARQLTGGPDGRGSRNPLANHNHRMEQLPTSAQNAIGGIYLVTEPRLGLRRVTADAGVQG